ncbi:protein phosphatase 1 regulatory subunit 14B-like [Scyliorhinus torazame]|uniref:protein phosphatase 1 regulatory subunit 14B-like n=1 Tax=Scyliorhinus torazame TaxID=75743 RepID=UPI003B5A51EC
MSRRLMDFLLLVREEEAIPELEIDVDELLDLESEEERAARVKELLIECYKPTDEFVKELLDKIRGMQKLHMPNKFSPQQAK